MKNIFSPALVAAMLFSASTAFAGGPIVIVEEPAPVVVAEKPRSGALIPLLLVGIVLCVALCGDDDEDRGDQPPPP